MKKFFSNKAVFVPIIVFITALVIIAICCNPASLSGRLALVRLAATIPINILFQILLYLSAAALLFLALHYLIRENSIVKRLIANLIIGGLCIFLSYSLITDSYVSPLRGSIKGDFQVWMDILSDLNDNESVCIENLNIKAYYMPGHTSHRYAISDSYYIVAIDEEKNSFRFAITEKDKSLIFGDDDSELKYGKIEYYKNSGLIKSISFYNDLPEKSEIQKVEINLTEEELDHHEKKILVNRPEIPDKENEKNLFWYVTKNGEFSECFQAYINTWTNFLTFADEGNYAVTLVINYDDATGEYTPISNTIKYTIV